MCRVNKDSYRTSRRTGSDKSSGERTFHPKCRGQIHIHFGRHSIHPKNKTIARISRAFPAYALNTESVMVKEIGESRDCVDIDMTSERFISPFKGFSDIEL